MMIDSHIVYITHIIIRITRVLMVTPVVVGAGGGVRAVLQLYKVE